MSSALGAEPYLCLKGRDFSVSEEENQIHHPTRGLGRGAASQGVLPSHFLGWAGGRLHPFLWVYSTLSGSPGSNSSPCQRAVVPYKIFPRALIYLYRRAPKHTPGCYKSNSNKALTASAVAAPRSLLASYPAGFLFIRNKRGVLAELINFIFLNPKR